MADHLIIKKQVSASIPSKYASFELSLFTTNQDNKEHLALVFGDVIDTDDVLVRIHSECFTGDILGSLRCDCGEQLQISMSQMAVEGRGIIVYLRQEGRGIGLIEKLKSYNLQDQGSDTIDANLALGHQEDERTYEIAAEILKEYRVKSLRLLTNNPKKVQALSHFGIKVKARLPIKASVHSHNAFYLLTKIKKMNHVFEEKDLRELTDKCSLTSNNAQPSITLAYAQSLDGAISSNSKQRLILSSYESMVMTHKLRSQNDAILVGVGTIIADDPLLTVRYYNGKNPQAIILDSHLRIPLTARVLKNPKPPLIFTSHNADPEKKEKLIKMKANIISIDCAKNEKINLKLMLEELFHLGFKSIMVEGGREIITNFINEDLVHKVVITVAPMFIGGISALSQELNTQSGFPRLKNIIQYKLGKDIIIMADVERMEN